jgi:diguanylate cyclase (GGDEF)-like protein
MSSGRVKSAGGPESDGEVLTEIEALASRRNRGLAFPGWLERRFEADTGARYAQVLAAEIKRSAIYYNLFLVGDFLLTPDTVELAVILHFLVVTPAMLLLAWLFRLRLAPFTRDIAAAATPFLITCQILCVFAFSHSATASHYLYFVAINVTTVNTSLRLRHRAARWATWAAFAALVATLAATHKIPIEVAVMQCFSFGVCGVVTLWGMADREREFRRAYLNALRDRLKIAAADAEANHDPLTGAANRRGLEIAVRSIWRDASPQETVAIILFDIDRFKAYNDLHGHIAGDACLKTIAGAALSRLAPGGGHLSRFGGEEFLALVTGSAARDAEQIAEQLRLAVLALDIAHEGSPERNIVSASFGVASGRVGEIGFEALLAAADAALYAAKSAGRNKVAGSLAA